MEGLRRRIYAEMMGRPGLEPGISVPSLPIGCFERIDRGSGIVWRLADSQAMGQFVRISLTASAADR